MRCNLPNMVRLTHIHERPGLVPEALWTFRVVLVNNNTLSEYCGTVGTVGTVGTSQQTGYYPLKSTAVCRSYVK